ncbi:hypothetical protein DPMN_067842 [Dreissena polymorpha]|uniref:Uncharacterized protein n=1 Tax=Dreissena polymorpha TaxID=45954 RepID=A0A9D4BTV4_DREPO|nr:hypothetical protein DPMN_067842 [Dreissena polymorpha]
MPFLNKKKVFQKTTRTQHQRKRQTERNRQMVRNERKQKSIQTNQNRRRLMTKALRRCGVRRKENTREERKMERRYKKWKLKQRMTAARMWGAGARVVILGQREREQQSDSVFCVLCHLCDEFLC